MKNFEKYSYLLATDQVESLIFSNPEEAKEFLIFHCLDLIKKGCSNWSSKIKESEEHNIRCIIERYGRISSVDFLSSQEEETLYFLFLEGNVCLKQY
ncbi:MAG: hypothetical protein HFJ34_03030 [Clostridia bacterium]|nr:hypothetical protein [Clostridia bacterium]